MTPPSAMGVDLPATKPLTSEVVQVEQQIQENTEAGIETGWVM